MFQLEYKPTMPKLASQETIAKATDTEWFTVSTLYIYNQMVQITTLKILNVGKTIINLV